MICRVKNCTSEIEKDGLCNLHYHKSIWLNNSDQNNLGIVKFADDIVPEWVRDKTADLHKEVLYSFFQMYDPTIENKYGRLLQEIGFRGAAKTTWAKIILLYVCCLAKELNEKFVVYCSETWLFAKQDTSEVKTELATNPRIKYYFGKISTRGVKDDNGEWSKDAYKTSTGVHVLARGVGQQIRSALRGSYRPTLAIINDMYSKESVKTEYGRKNYRDWFFTDLFNAVDDILGKVFLNGTILHEDTVQVILKSNSRWKTLEYPIMNLQDFENAKSYCTLTEAHCRIPSDELIASLEPKYHLYWKDRLNLKYILSKYAEAYESRQLDMFYQEYFHVVTAPGARNFENIIQVPMRYFKTKGQNWLEVTFPGSKPQIFPVNIFLGVDPASSTEAHAKFTVIAILMMNQHRQVFYYGYSRGRYGIRDEMRPEFSNKKNGDIVDFEMDHVLRKGIVDEELRFVRKYSANGAKIETTQAQKHIYTEIARLMRVNNIYHQLFEEKPQQDKISRDAEMLVPDFQANAAFVNLGCDELMIEFRSFPRGSTVDIIDAYYHARSIARPCNDLNYSTYTRKSKFDTSKIEYDMNLL